MLTINWNIEVNGTLYQLNAGNTPDGNFNPIQLLINTHPVLSNLLDASKTEQGLQLINKTDQPLRIRLIPSQLPSRPIDYIGNPCCATDGQGVISFCLASARVITPDPDPDPDPGPDSDTTYPFSTGITCVGDQHSIWLEMPVLEAGDRFLLLDHTGNVLRDAQIAGATSEHRIVSLRDAILGVMPELDLTCNTMSFKYQIAIANPTSSLKNLQIVIPEREVNLFNLNGYTPTSCRAPLIKNAKNVGFAFSLGVLPVAPPPPPPEYIVCTASPNISLHPDNNPYWHRDGLDAPYQTVIMKYKINGDEYTHSVTYDEPLDTLNVIASIRDLLAGTGDGKNYPPQELDDLFTCGDSPGVIYHGYFHYDLGFFRTNPRNSAAEGEPYESVISADTVTVEFVLESLETDTGVNMLANSRYPDGFTLYGCESQSWVF